MLSTYLKYFVSYIFRARNRQRLLILAIVGLFLSSMSLIVLQSSMGGLQNSVTGRSKEVLGNAVIYHKDSSSSDVFANVFDVLDDQNINYSKEYELEVLLRYGQRMTPVLVHGIDTKGFIPEFLNPFFKNAFHKEDSVIPVDLAYKIGVAPPEDLQIISPAHVDELLGEIPRGQSIRVDHTLLTNVPEIDQFHMWVRIPLIHNLIQSYSLNRIRIYSDVNFAALKKKLPSDVILKTWEEENSTLVWALNLENTVMIFLFIGMSLLVSLCITSGLMIFFSKIKTDLSSFWILGASFSQIQKSTKFFLHFISFASIIFGLLCGLLLLWFLHSQAPNIMPDVFVDRKLPILVTPKGLLVSFLVPYVISLIFVNFAFTQFKKDHDVLDHVRSIS